MGRVSGEGLCGWWWPPRGEVDWLDFARGSRRRPELPPEGAPHEPR